MAERSYPGKSFPGWHRTGYSIGVPPSTEHFSPAGPGRTLPMVLARTSAGSAIRSSPKCQVREIKSPRITQLQRHEEEGNWWRLGEGGLITWESGITLPEGEQGDKRNELTETKNQHFMSLLKVVFKNETKNHKVKFIFPYSFFSSHIQM